MKSDYDGGSYLPFNAVEKQDDPNAIYIAEPVHDASSLVLSPVKNRIGYSPAKLRK